MYREQGRGRDAGSQPTYLADLYAAQVKHDPAAMGRLERHGRMIEDRFPDFGRKMRAIGSGAVSGGHVGPRSWPAACHPYRALAQVSISC